MNTAPEPIQRPSLTMPIAEARVLHDAYEAASTIYEYGAGGSTVLAGDMPGKQIFCVETDELWVVLVDGRLRAACVLATAFRCSQPVRVLVDDYTQRATYHVVEKYLGAPRITGRLAEFNVTPTAIDATHLLEIISIMQDPY